MICTKSIKELKSILFVSFKNNYNFKKIVEMKYKYADKSKEKKILIYF